MTAVGGTDDGDLPLRGGGKAPGAVATGVAARGAEDDAAGGQHRGIGRGGCVAGGSDARLGWRGRPGEGPLQPPAAERAEKGKVARVVILIKKMLFLKKVLFGWEPRLFWPRWLRQYA
jgi:hypothetical protein